jgi:hypothetical protein
MRRAQALLERTIEKRVPEEPDFRRFSNSLRAGGARRGEACAKISDYGAAIFAR